MHKTILSLTSVPSSAELYWFDTIESTNTYAKLLARDGAPHGTAVAAGLQTGGRGRLGRSFSSPAGLGAYVSVILRPGCRAEELMHLTCAAAVAAADAVEKVTALRPGIKWTNDLVVEKRKLGGILTELGVDASGFVEYAVVGVGINCLQTLQDFPPEIQSFATSATMACGRQVFPAQITAALLDAIRTMALSDKAGMLARYKKDCITLGQTVVVVRGDEKRYGLARDLDENGSLLVAFDDGSERFVTSGEVSVRGMYGYV